MAKKIYVGDIGTEFYFDTTIDLSIVEEHKVYVLKPGASAEVVWTTAVHTVQDEARYLKCVSVASGDMALDTAGRWKAQAWVRNAGGSEWRGDTVEFTVYAQME